MWRACCVLIFCFFWGLAPTQGQIPIDVFAQHNRIEQEVTLYFANPITGLSIPVVIAGFRQQQNLLQSFTLTPTGVLFQNPRDGRILLADANGNLRPHPFIPQQSENLARVDWVLSPDKQSLAWVEVFPSENQWISNVYLSDHEGREIIALPPPPLSQAAPFRRALPLALSNDRQQLFLDLAAELEPQIFPQFFVSYADIQLYLADRQLYLALPNEPNCLCGAGMGKNLFLRLEVAEGGGFDLHWWDLLNNSEVVLLPLSPRFAQAGDFLMTPDSAYYTLGQNLESDSVEVQFGVVAVDFATRQQKFLIEPTAQRFQALALRGNLLILADVYGGGTYKLDLRTQVLDFVSEYTWLGVLEG